MTDFDSTEFVNEITLNLLMSKSQLQKLNKIRQNENSSRDDVIYNKDRVSKLFNNLLNNNRPDDLLEDVKSSFDNFIEKSIYYLEIHDKNISLQKERDGSTIDELETSELEVDELETSESEVDELYVDESTIDELEDFELDDFEEPLESIIKVNKKHSKNPFVKNGVDDIQKLPLDWFNTTRQSYKLNQIIPRKSEIVINNSAFYK